MRAIIVLLVTFGQGLPPANGEVIDRIVAVVENHIITLSDIRAEKTMREVLGEPSTQNDRELLDELIEQHLIHTQLEQYPRAEPAEAELDEELRQIKDRKGLPLEIIRAAIREHLRVQRFFMERFGQFITATDAEVQRYYDEVFVPAAHARGMVRVPGSPRLARTFEGMWSRKSWRRKLKSGCNK